MKPKNIDELEVLAIVPARGGSKRIPDKNLQLIGGEPLIAHTLRHARYSSRVTGLCVSTDDDNIAAVAQKHGAQVVFRPPELASDTASSELALLHVLDDRRTRGIPDPDIVVFLQCTSPVRRSDDIDRAIEQFVSTDADTMFSACPNDRLIWKVGRNGPKSINYDFRNRRRDQEMPAQYRENGSIYVFKPAKLREYKNRLGGRISIFQMDYWTSFQIDTPEHVRLIEWILQLPEYKTQADWPEVLDLIVFDFDGVMTDNTVITNQRGEESVICNRADGLALRAMRGAEIPMLVLSMEENPVVEARCRKIGLHCVQGVHEKSGFLRDYLSDQKFDAAKTVYLGNDVNDLNSMRLVGYPIAVADAHPEVRKIARFVLSTAGGKGAVRELCQHLHRSLAVLRYQDLVI